jgi:hypothetical protein
MARGISRKLYDQCRDVLLQCSEFGSDQALRSIFVSQDLRPFQSRLPSAQNQVERVDFLLDYLLGKRLADDRSVLFIFLSQLCSRYPNEDAIYSQLDKLLNELAPPSREDGVSPLLSGGDTSPQMSSKKSVKLFFSYAHEDESLRNELAHHLSNLKRQSIITTWHDREISAGSNRQAEIDHNLNTADIVLLLVSQYFLDSDYCWSIELQKAMARHKNLDAWVLPIILRPVDWEGSPFSQLQALPKDARPVTTWENQDEAFLDISRGIRSVAEKIIAKQNEEN